MSVFTFANSVLLPIFIWIFTYIFRLSFQTENVSTVPRTGKLILLWPVLCWMSIQAVWISQVYFFKYKIKILYPIALLLPILHGVDLQITKNSSVSVIGFYSLKLKANLAFRSIYLPNFVSDIYCVEMNLNTK